jgi:hypothetical protein
VTDADIFLEKTSGKTQGESPLEMEMGYGQNPEKE